MRLVPYSESVGILLVPPAADPEAPAPAPTASWDSPTIRMTWWQGREVVANPRQGMNESPSPHLRADLGRVCPEGLEHACSDALALPQEAQEDVLSPDVIVAELPGLFERHLQHTLGPRCERDLHGHETTATALGGGRQSALSAHLLWEKERAWQSASAAH